MPERKKMVKPTGSNALTASAGAEKQRFLLIFVCVFVSAVLLVGIIFGTIFAVRAANSAVEYNGVRMNKTVANYFASYAKSYYMAHELSDVDGALDTPQFWSTLQTEDKTYGDGMREYVENYLASIVVGCYLYDSVKRLDSSAKAEIKNIAEQRLLYIADGDKRVFNGKVEQYGFDYDAFYTATEMAYKSSMAMHLLYGVGGSGLESDTELCDEYYNLMYRRVHLLFIRTERDFRLDSDGKRILDDNGDERLFVLTTAEREARRNDIAAIDEAIANLESGNDDNQMSEISFGVYLKKYAAANLGLDPNGEYYAANSDYANRAYGELPTVVTTALEMSPGEYRKVEIEDLGVCYLYCDSLAPGAYRDTDEYGPFSDFYTRLASFKYGEDIDALIENVDFNKRFYEINLINLPCNGTYTIGI